MVEESAEKMPEPEAAPKPAGGLKKESIWEVYFPSRLNEDKVAIPLASFPMIIYFWPSMLAYLMCGALQQLGVDDGTLGWIATGFFAFNLMVIVTDLDQKKFIITALLILVVGLTLWITTLKDWTFVASVGGWLAGLEIIYSTHAYYLIFVLLWVFFFLGMITPRINYWRIEPNEFVHYIQPWGRDQSIPRLGSTVTREIPDVLELMLTFGGGSLVIRRENQVVARIQHVPFLGRRMIAIERMLGVTRVKTMESHDD